MSDRRHVITARTTGPHPTGPKRRLRDLLKRNEVGINIAPTPKDDGWQTPQPVALDDGSSIRLWKDGEALKRAYDEIEKAKRRVCFEFYTWNNDATGRAFAELLTKKAVEGVHVYCIYDSFGTFGGNDREMFRQMRRQGVRVAEFHPLRPWEGNYSWRPFSRDHRKLVIVDDAYAGIGGLNIADPYAGPWVAPNDLKPVQLWRDTALGIRGPAVRHFAAAFAKTWNYVHKGGRINRVAYLGGVEVPRPTKGPRVGVSKTGEARRPIVQHGSLGVIATAPTLNSPLRPILYGLINCAQRRIRMTMAYFAPDDTLIRSLTDAAKRGVKVQLMFGAKSDLPVMVTAARSFYSRLMAADVEIYERQFVVLHAKTIVVDDMSIVGSTNLDYRSTELNCEMSAIIRSDAFAGEMDKMFEHDMKFSRRIDPAEWGKRPLLDKVAQWITIHSRQLL